MKSVLHFDYQILLHHLSSFYARARGTWSWEISLCVEISVFGTVMPCSLVEVYWCFREPSCLHLRGTVFFQKFLGGGAQKVCPVSIKFHPNWMKNVENRGRISFTPLSDLWLSLHRFSWNKQLLNTLYVSLLYHSFTVKICVWYLLTGELATMNSKLLVQCTCNNQQNAAGKFPDLAGALHFFEVTSKSKFFFFNELQIQYLKNLHGFVLRMCFFNLCKV